MTATAITALTRTATDIPTTEGGARPGGAAGAVWDALTTRPGATATVIAEAAGVSRSATGKALTALEGDGRVTRVPGGRDGRTRLPDTWTASTPPAIGAPDDDPDAVDTNTEPSDPGPDPAEIEPGTPAATGAGSQHAPDADGTDDDVAAAGDNGDGQDPDVGTGGGGAGLDVVAVSDARDALNSMLKSAITALDALKAGDGAAAVEAAEAFYAGSARVRRLVRAAAEPRRSGSGAPRSHPGELRAMVAAHLNAHPGAELTPYEIGRVIGRSAGAVSNALDRLVGLGEAVVTCERPRRFAIATPAETTAPGLADPATATA